MTGATGPKPCFGLAYLDVRPDSDSKPKPPRLDLKTSTKDARQSTEI